MCDEKSKAVGIMGWELLLSHNRGVGNCDANFCVTFRGHSALIVAPKLGQGFQTDWGLRTCLIELLVWRHFLGSASFVTERSAICSVVEWDRIVFSRWILTSKIKSNTVIVFLNSTLFTLNKTLLCSKLQWCLAMLLLVLFCSTTYYFRVNYTYVEVALMSNIVLFKTNKALSQ